MGIEISNGATVVTGEHVKLFHYTRVATALALEINTGMRMSSRGSTMKLAAGLCGSAKRTKRGVLADLTAFTVAAFPGYTFGDSVKKALQAK